MTSTGWNLADVWEAIAGQIPDALAQQQGDRTTSWADFDRRANGIASTLLASDGAAEQDKVAQYLHNCPAYLESVFGAFKAGMAIVNTNYRYTPDEIEYLWDNGDVTTVVFHGTFTDRCDVVRGRLPRITKWLWVDDGAGTCPDWAT
ncbi:MAG: AMP-binding protein, partial [Actinomycetota bacterium]